MQPFVKEHLDAVVSEVARGDRDLEDELIKKIVLTDQQVERHRKSIGIASTALLVDKNLPTAAGKFLLETIARAEGRPVLTIKDNQVTGEFLGPKSKVWEARIAAASKILASVIPAVGRVEVSNHPEYTWVGTGWLVDKDIIVTNRHVAREFARRGERGFVFRSGVDGAAISCTLDFLEEYERGSELTFVVESVLWISKYGGPDVAFLRLRPDPLRALPKPVPLAAAPQVDAFVATIGYPARDSRVPDQALVRQLFGDIYEKKRLAPGLVVELDGEELLHDCSTLGGNSGSLVVDLQSGEAVGLHFAGQYMHANFAVPSTRIAELLAQVRAGTVGSEVVVSGVPGVRPAASPILDTSGSVGSGSVASGFAASGVVASGAAAAAAAYPGVPTDSSSSGSGWWVSPDRSHMSIRLHVPLDITVSLGGPCADPSPTLVPPAPLRADVTGPAAANPGPPAEDHLASALAAAQAALQGNKDVLDVRLGYRFKRGWITDERVVVVEVANKQPIPALAKAEIPIIPNHFLGVGVDVRTGGLLEQLEHLGIDVSMVDLEGLEGRIKPGQYREPPHLSLVAIDEVVQATFHVSPDAGFPTLSAFLGRVEESLTATMYEWEPNHVSDAIAGAITGRKTLMMVTQLQGTEDAVEDMQQRLGARFKHVWASVGKGHLIPNHYHIKVASRDGEELWLSSGNWKESNQPNIDPIASNSSTLSALRKYNREWHAVIASKKLARLFQRYIEWDFAEAERVPREELPEVSWPELFVPEERESITERPEVRYFKPLQVNRKLEIQPLLTPDRDERDRRIFMTFAARLVRAATRHLYIQNQSFALLGPGNNEDAFEDFFTALKERQDAGVDVRIVFRDPREFSYNTGSETLATALERLKDFGLDTDKIKVQKKLHTKAIMVDSEQVLLGSHNLTNTGALYNRDASLIVRDPEVTRYFEEIFLYDWDVLAKQSADESVGGMRIAARNESTPPGFRRMTMADLGLI